MKKRCNLTESTHNRIDDIEIIPKIVEQKNWTHVRQLFGYERIEDQRLVDLMNKIYEVQNFIQNFPNNLCL